VATDAINRRQLDRVVGVVRTHASPYQHRIGVLGLAYKPGTPVVEESQGVMLANRLAADGFATSVFDPAALPDAAAVLAPSISYARALVECVESCHVLVLMVALPEFREIPALLRERARKPLVIVDCWRQLAPADLEGLADLVHLGKAWAPSVATDLVSQK
jgi:UDPglucose 6-dehydrogenase